jgi:hypothetical protein
VGHPAWERVCGWLHDDCAQQGDAVGDLYYSLALGDLPAVAHTMARSLTKMAGTQWLGLLDTVTAAPRRMAENHGSTAPVTQAHQLTQTIPRDDQPAALIADLIAGLWVVSDPLCGEPRAPLHWYVAGSYQDLHGYLRDIPEQLHQLQREHQRLAGL